MTTQVAGRYASFRYLQKVRVLVCTDEVAQG
jgi:hypothetical protein